MRDKQAKTVLAIELNESQSKQLLTSIKSFEIKQANAVIAINQVTR